MIIPIGFAQVNIRFTGEAAPQTSEVVYGVENTVNPKTPLVLAQAAADHWIDVVLPFLQTTITLATVLAKLGPNDVGPFAEVSVGQNGQSIGGAVPPQVALLVTKVTDFGGRRGRGRMYIPGIDETNVSPGGLIDGTDLAAYQTMADDLLAAHSAGDNPMTLLHGETVAAPPYEITSLQVQDMVATQKRRLRG